MSQLNRKGPVKYELLNDLNKPAEEFTETECYILGWFFSDAGISTKAVNFKIQEKDYRTVRKIKEYLGYSGPIRIEKRKSLGELVKHCKCQDRVILNIGRTEFAKRLLNLKNNEDYTELFNKLDESQKWSFLRGLQDGDGCVSYAVGNYGFKFEVIG